MPKRTKVDSFKRPQIIRVHPNDLPTKYHRTRLDPAANIDNDEYELEPIARADDHLSLSSVLNLRAESPEIEVIEVSPPMKTNITQRTVYHADVSNALVPVQSSSMKQPPIRSFIVSPTSHLLREVSVIPTRTATIMPIEEKEEEIVPEPVHSPKKPTVLMFVLISSCCFPL